VLINNYHFDLQEALSSSKISLQPFREDILLCLHEILHFSFLGGHLVCLETDSIHSQENFDCGFKLWIRSLLSV
jgi:hypothetical protein